ncbi:S1 RNA-binding domain-containing protein [Streptomyces sp. NPDC098789]|uniref:S1 RNA-binding domain-containing protein n=1 Tax=Streptomyces sp. NPDC098789 TaxID=3366098 RepID=UPI00382CB560
MPSFVHRITKYDPADRDEDGSYIGAEEPVSDHGPVEAAYLRAVAAFAEDTGVDRLTVRGPGISGSVHFGPAPTVDGHGLAGLFPPDLSGFHDGAEVPLAVALELVRVMLRGSGAWCRLEVEGRFAVHVDWDQYVYVSSDRPCAGAVARTRALGLFPERTDSFSPDEDEDDEPGVQRPADEDFWDRVRWLVATWHAVVLEEGFVHNTARWHRLTRDTLDPVRARLAPRSRLTVWPDLSTDVAAVLAALPPDSVEFVWEDEDGAITSTEADACDYPALASRMAGARAAAALAPYGDERRALLAGVLPDGDGVLRARWRTPATPSDLNWAFLKTLRRGQICTGTVVAMPDFGVTFVDIGGFTAMINLPELSWHRVEHPRDLLDIGQEVSAEILDVDLSRERVSLSLKRLRPDPSRQFLE